jgi:dolichol-phosphate mannosyltransferase
MLLSIVIPVYNEAGNLQLTLRALQTELCKVGCDAEIVFVNDGSTDESQGILAGFAAADSAIKVLNFSRNFGHQAAITAGLDFAAGDAVVIMDADLQDPPEILADMVKLYQQGYDVVSAQRVSREGEGVFKRLTASAFYWIMQRAVDRRIVPEVGDFRLLSRAAVLALRRFREQHRFMRGLVAWLGLKEAILPFRRQPRAAGETKYTLFKMIRLAWTAVASFSALPLRLSIAAGVVLSLAGFGSYACTRPWCWAVVPGWTRWSF